MARALGIVVVAAGTIGFVGAIVIPGIALAVGAGTGACADGAAIWPSARQWGLYGRTVGMAVCGTALAMVLALPGAWAIARVRRFSHAPLVGALAFVPLLMPPMIVVFGWQRLLGGYWFRDLSPMARCVWVWASWGWPIPAMILAAGWMRVGRSVCEAAVLVTTPGNAFLRAVAPSLRRHVMVSAVILLVWFVGEYSVPHANGVFVMASELMDTAGQSAAGEMAVRVLGLSWPLIVVTVAGIVVASKCWPAPDGASGGMVYSEATSRRGKALVLMIVIVGVTCGLPLTGVAGRRALIGDLAETVTTYWPELLGSVGLCTASGVLAVIMGMALTAGVRPARIGLVGTFLFGVVPGAVVGSAMLSAYRPAEWMNAFPRAAEASWWFYGHWPIVLIGLAGRFAWVGWLAGWMATRGVPRAHQEQSSLDGAAGLTQTVTMCWRHQWPVLVCGVAVASAMAMSEFAVVGVVGVPSPTMLAMLVIEKFHRFEYGMLAALSVCLMVSAVPGTVLVWAVLRRREWAGYG
ncbi:MAG: hypothetical protein HOP29_12115 [Phycisphaerales bacterium]|nr:hypothetical protein [Phycisphaerales bacterium]